MFSPVGRRQSQRGRTPLCGTSSRIWSRLIGCSRRTRSTVRSMRLARGELSWDEVDPVVREVGERCVRARDLTGGLFDAELPGGGWDPSGLVKGWAVERAAERLREVPDLDWCLNAGGDLLVLCPSSLPFTVGIQDPRDPGRVVTSVARSDGAVATSGTAARGAHLYDPRTGDPVDTRWLSVSVSGPSLEYADVLATAAFVAGEEWPGVLAALPGYEGLGILADGNLFATVSWPWVKWRRDD